MRKLLSLISAVTWAGLAAWVIASTPGNADKVVLYCIGALALTGAAAAIFTFVVRQTFVIAYCFILSILFAVPSVPSTLLQFSLCMGNLLDTPAIAWLGTFDLAILICLPLAWAYQLRQQLNDVAAERLTSRCS